MRVLLGMVLFSMVGCDALWASYIGTDLGTDGSTGCSDPAGCVAPGGDMATAAPDDMSAPDLNSGPIACSAIMPCPGSALNCDLNTGFCTTDPLPTTAFLPDPSESTALDQPYMLMATGDYDNDGMADIAVSGVFTGVGNSNAASVVSVDIYPSNGLGGLKTKESCVLGGSDKPVYLLTIPGAQAEQKDLLVATYGGPIYRCAKQNNKWMAKSVATIQSSGPALPTGFKQLALVNNEGQTKPDLVVRTNSSLFSDATPSGNVDVHRAANGAGNINYDGLAGINITTTDATWVQPYRIGTGTGAGESIGVTWDAIGAHPGVEFHYISPANNEMKQGSGGTGPADVMAGAGPGFMELAMKPYAATALFHLSKTATGILFTYSQSVNSITVLYGSDLIPMSPNLVKPHGQQTLTGGPAGMMLPYAGDANGDDIDEIGIYTMALNTNPLTRHLQLLSYKDPMIVSSPIVDITLTMENFRGMALEYLGGMMDSRRLAKRKDLIALVEKPGGGSRLLIRRANLNYKYQ